jgi:hypothetical protein
MIRTDQERNPNRLYFNLDYHAALTTAACPDDPKIKDELDVIVAANLATDANQFNSAWHFDNCAFGPGTERIEDLWGLIRSTTVETNTFVDFGTMIHTVEDFYAHSNWIELHTDVDPIPTWDLQVGSLPADIVSGTFLLDWPKLCGPNAPTHAELNKDSPTSTEGAKIVQSGPNAGKSLFDLAYATALQATRDQFAELSKVVNG